MFSASYRSSSQSLPLNQSQIWNSKRISHDEILGKCLGVLSCDNDVFDQPAPDVSIEGWERCYLQVRVDYDKLQFDYSPDGQAWRTLGPVLDASKLSDEYCREGTFTGAMVGLCCQDLSGKGRAVDFDFFEYREKRE